jgi:YqaJ-like viral recombinase domain
MPECVAAGRASPPNRLRAGTSFGVRSVGGDLLLSSHFSPGQSKPFQIWRLDSFLIASSLFFAPTEGFNLTNGNNKNIAQKTLESQHVWSVNQFAVSKAFTGSKPSGDRAPPYPANRRGQGTAADIAALANGGLMSDLQRQSLTPVHLLQFNPADRRSFIGGSDARVIMGSDESTLLRLWREKRGEADPEDLSDNLAVQLGTVTEDLNRRWYERHTGHTIKHSQRRMQHPVNKWMAATLDGLIEPSGAVFEAKFMLPWSFSEEAAAEKHMAQLQHNMWVANSRTAVLSIITGGGKWLEMTIHADPLYQHLLLTAEKKFWRCVMTAEPPSLFSIEPPRPRLEAIRVVDMSGSNSWAELAAVFRRTRPAHQEHEDAKAGLKKLVPEDAREALGHGLRAKRSKSGAVSFDLLDIEVAHAPL